MSHPSDPADRRTRLLFLNRSYFPDMEATGQLLTELCEDLADRFDVAVICGQPNFAEAGTAYRRWGTETVRGVDVHRVWHSRFSKGLLPARLFNLLSYLLGAAMRSLAVRPPDVVVVETDPPLLCMLGAMLRQRFRCKLVVYLQDIYPDVGVALGKLPDNALTRLLRKWFFDVYRSAERVVVLGEDMGQVLLSAGVARWRIATIPNWADTARIQPCEHAVNAFRRRHGLDGKFVVMYSGNLGLCQGLDDMVGAAARLRPREDIQLLVIGDGVSRRRLEREAAVRQLSNVRFLDYQPRCELSCSLSAADLHLLPLDPRVARCVMPSKLYGILSAGRPMIGVVPPDCELARIIATEDVGFLVRPGDAAALADRIAWCADNPEQLAPMRRLARRLAVEHFDRRTMTGRFARLLEEVSGVAASKRSAGRVRVAQVAERGEDERGG